MLVHPHSFLSEEIDFHVCLWKSLLPTFISLREGGGFISNLPLSSFISLSFSVLLQNSLVPSLSARPSILWSGETLCPHSFLWGIQFLNIFLKSVPAPFIVLPFHLFGISKFPLSAFSAASLSFFGYRLPDALVPSLITFYRQLWRGEAPYPHALLIEGDWSPWILSKVPPTLG